MPHHAWTPTAPSHTASQNIECRSVFGQGSRMPEVIVKDNRRQAEARGDLRRDRQRSEWCELMVEVVLSNKGRKPKVLGFSHHIAPMCNVDRPPAVAETKAE